MMWKVGGCMVDKAKATAVALDDATVAFRLSDARVYTAVEKARLRIEHGEFVAIVGPTGCGKSTLLNVAAGLLRPSSGTVRIFDFPLAGLNRQAGYLFQADALFPWKTAIDNVAIGLEVSGVPRAHARASSATGACRFRGPAIFPRSAWRRIFTPCIVKSGACSRTR